MKCPDCGSRLADVMAEGIACHRCFKCGGFFAGSNVVNSLTSATINVWRRIKIDSMWLSGGSGMCPLDGMLLQKYIGDAVPGNMDVKRCARCGKWWFPGDALQEFKPAQEARSLYFRLWGITQGAASLVLPTLAGLLILGGLGVSLYLVKQPQHIQVPAYVADTSFVVEYKGFGTAVVRYRALVASVDYRILNTEEWTTDEDGILEGLTEGVVYEVRMGLRSVLFETN